jgi:hypothetical protein
LPDGASGIFLREPLDRLLVICPSCQLVAPDDAILSLQAPRRNPYRRRTLERLARRQSIEDRLRWQARGDFKQFGLALPPLIGATSALIFFQQPCQLGEIEPPPVGVQAGEKFEFATRENRHQRDSSPCVILLAGAEQSPHGSMMAKAASGRTMAVDVTARDLMADLLD